MLWGPGLRLRVGWEEGRLARGPGSGREGLQGPSSDQSQVVAEMQLVAEADLEPVGHLCLQDCPRPQLPKREAGGST